MKMVENLKKMKNYDIMKKEVDEFLFNIKKYLNREKNLLRHRYLLGMISFLEGILLKISMEITKNAKFFKNLIR